MVCPALPAALEHPLLDKPHVQVWHLGSNHILVEALEFRHNVAWKWDSLDFTINKKENQLPTKKISWSGAERPARASQESVGFSSVHDKEDIRPSRHSSWEDLICLGDN